MTDDGGAYAMRSSSIPVLLKRLWIGVTNLQFGGSELGTRFALIVLGLAAMTAARSLSFIDSVPDSMLPHIPPLVWTFHQADMMFVPGGSRLPNLSAVQQVQFVALIAALMLFWLAVRPTVPALLKRFHRPLAYFCIALATLLGLLNLQGLLPFPLALGTHHYGNDAITVTSCATDEFLGSRNPYTAFAVIPCLSQNGQDGTKTTPLMAGSFARSLPYPSKVQLIAAFNKDKAAGVRHPVEFESSYSYPSISFLLPAIVVALHLHDLSVFYLLVYAVLATLVVYRTPNRTARWMVAIAVCANAALGPTLISGSTDALYTLLILLAWISRDKRWFSAVAIGLAVASRQQAWFYLLFYAVLILRTSGKREMWWRMGIVAGLFAITNAPYIFASPGPWLDGVLGPLRDPMFPRGSGLIAISTGGVASLPIGPRWLYSGLEVGGLVASLAYYWRICRAQPWTGLVLAPMALLFAWRSLYSYFLPITLLALYPAFVAYAGDSPIPEVSAGSCNSATAWEAA